MRTHTETKPSANEAKIRSIDRRSKLYDPVEREKELKKLEEMRSRFILMASHKYHYPYRPLKIKPKAASLISRMFDLKAIEQGVGGMIKSIIF